MSTDDQGTKWRRNIAKKFQLAEYGTQALETDDRRQMDSIQRTFTFAKKVGSNPRYTSEGLSSTVSV